MHHSWYHEFGKECYSIAARMTQNFSRILLAPSAYKGTLDASAVALALNDGVKVAMPLATVQLAPIADGGDGTLAAVHAVRGGTFHKVPVLGAMNDFVEAEWLELDGVAVVELAGASGLGMLQGRELQPLTAHSFGTGQVMLDALQKGTKELIVCVGGSASTDGGAGALQALGAHFLDSNRMELAMGGGALSGIVRCDLSKLERWRSAQISVATDVTSPLLGEHGAAHIFAPQKGAGPYEVEQLEEALKRFANVLEKDTGKFVRNLAGSGAAGGTAFGLACALGAQIISGFEWLSEMADLENKIAACDLVVTAEGCLDHQSLTGKATGELAKMCTKLGKPLWAVPALVQKDLDWRSFGITRVIESCSNGRAADALTIAAAMRAALQT